jgi:uncharacterized membrane protein HdeD (DUF308 family)
MSITLSRSPATLSPDERASMRPLWWLFMILGLVSIVVGFLAISSYYIATMASVVVFGVLLLIAGATEVVHAVLVRNLKGFALHLLAAALYLLVGLFFLEHPVRGARVLTLLLGAGFLVGGLLRIIFSVVMRFPGWSWVMFLGVVDLILGGIILSGWPGSSEWVIGLFVGIDLLFNGWAWVFLALSVRTYTAPSLA